MKRNVSAILLFAVLSAFLVCIGLTIVFHDTVILKRNARFSLLAPLPAEDSFINPGDEFTSQVYYSYNVKHGDCMYIVGKLTYEDEGSVSTITVYEEELDSSGYADTQFVFPELDIVAGEHPITVDFYFVSKSDGVNKTLEDAKRLKYTMIQPGDSLNIFRESIAQK